MARFGFCAASSLLWGDGGLLLLFILSKIAILDKIDGKFVTPLPHKSRMEKWRVLAFARVHHCFGGGGGNGGLLFLFILSKIVVIYYRGGGGGLGWGGLVQFNFSIHNFPWACSCHCTT